MKAKIAGLRRKEANARKDYLHQLSNWIAKNRSVVKLEKLRVNNMTASAAGTVEEPTKSVAQKRSLDRSILDHGWGMFADMFGYKCPVRSSERQFVPPPYTSGLPRVRGWWMPRTEEATWNLSALPAGTRTMPTQWAHAN
jgi:putative transposase